MNWPVARVVADYLLIIIDFIEEEILLIFKSKDLIWIDWILVVFGGYFKNEQIKQEVIRIAISPTELEKLESVNETALEIVKNRNWI